MAFAMATATEGVGSGIAAVGGLAKLGMSLAGRKSRIAEQKAAKEAMAKRMSDYENLDTSNLNANVENKFQNQQNAYEDLTVNTQQAEFESQQSQQSQANIMSSLSGAAGGSGIAALAQTMANQGQLQAQKASASIGMQEAANEKLRAGEASKLQYNKNLGEERAEGLRLSGAETARGLEYGKTSTLLGMSQQRVGAANQARAEALAQQMSAVGDIASAFGGAAAEMNMGTPGEKKTNTGNGYLDLREEARKNALANNMIQND
tara:strand:+ start:158 stop:946 length:789 start_codon:yes stop_codon:yes gene_type:complete